MFPLAKPQGTDTVPAMLSPGEMVLTPQQQKAVAVTNPQPMLPSQLRRLRFLHSRAVQAGTAPPIPLRPMGFQYGGTVPSEASPGMQGAIGPMPTPYQLARPLPGGAAMGRPFPMQPPIYRPQMGVQSFQEGGVAKDRYDAMQNVNSDQPFSRVEQFSPAWPVPAHPKSDAEYGRLPPGAMYVDPDDGKTYRKGFDKGQVI